MTKIPSLSAPFGRTQLVHAARSKVLPLALVGGLLVFGARGALAADRPNDHYVLGGDAITVIGNGVSSEMQGRALHVTVASGGGEIDVGGSRKIMLASGDDLTLTPLSMGSVRSISISVGKGQAVVMPFNPRQTMSPSVITPMSNLSFPTGVDDKSVDGAGQAQTTDSPDVEVLGVENTD